jgi:hypothetical protein
MPLHVLGFGPFLLHGAVGKPLAMVLLTWMGVGGCGWPNSRSVLIMGTASWPLIYPAPILASAADPTTMLLLLHIV